MANKKPSNGFDKDRKRASRAGKKSSNALPQDLKEARLENAQVFESTLYKYMNTPLDELKKIFKDPKTPARDLAVIAILTNAIQKGDNARLNFLLDRTIGKVKDVTDLNVNSTHKQLIDLLNEKD